MFEKLLGNQYRDKSKEKSVSSILSLSSSKSKLSSLGCSRLSPCKSTTLKNKQVSPIHLRSKLSSPSSDLLSHRSTDISGVSSHKRKSSFISDLNIHNNQANSFLNSAQTQISSWDQFFQSMGKRNKPSFKLERRRELSKSPSEIPRSFLASSSSIQV